MSSVSQTGEKCLGWEPSNILKRIRDVLDGFFRVPEVTKRARIWHGDISYSLVPNTSIRSFNCMSPVTSVDAGDCYICIFDKDVYKGSYQIIGPGEKALVNNCASLVVSLRKISVESVRNSTSTEYWEMDGPLYMAHFSKAYRYA